MRCSMSPTLLKAPSAVWAKEIPSLALREATARPRTWVLMRSAMAKPAASSLALLTRKPEDRRCIDVASEPPDKARLRWALIETTLVLIDMAMVRFL